VIYLASKRGFFANFSNAIKAKVSAKWDQRDSAEKVIPETQTYIKSQRGKI
jgi:hypothetical protein